MDLSRRVSEFTVHPKTTSPEATQQKVHGACHFCAENLAKVTTLRKNEILMQLQLEKLKQQLSQVQTKYDDILAARTATYQQYQKTLEVQYPQYWNRQDIEAELFEAKVIIELLLVSKSIHPQLKSLDEPCFKQKYSDLLLENLRLHEKVQVRDKIIAEKSFFPLYHQDKRMNTLRKAVEFWFRKYNEECMRMKQKVKEFKIGFEEEKNYLREQMRRAMEENKEEMVRFMDSVQKNRSFIREELPKKARTNSTIQEKKKTSGIKQTGLKKMR